MPTGVATAYDLTVGVVVNMDETIYLLSPADSPMISGLASDGLSVISSRPVDEIVFSWLDDTILTPRSTVAAIVTADAEINVATGDRTKFSTGDVIMVSKTNANDGSGEKMRVTGYSATTATTLLVTRGLTGSATTYASDSIVLGLGTALSEGSDPEAARTVDRVESSNVTQIFGPTSVHVSATEQVVRKYGVRNEMTHQLMARMKENVISREQAFLYGTKFNSTTAKIRTTGGLASFITTNVNTSSTQLTVANINTLQQSLYNRGGSPDRLMANPVALSDLNDLGNTSVVRVEVSDGRRGRVRTSYVDTEFGSVAIVRNRWVTSFDAFLFEREHVIRRVLRPLTFEMLAKTGDADKGQIVCEEGLEVVGQSHMARFEALSYSGGN
jgi:hypothetical protein